MNINGPLNEFGYLLTKLCERQGKSINGVARLAGFTGNSRIYYAIRRKTSPKQRTTPLTEDELLRLAKALRLSVEAEEQFVITAQLESVPPRMRKYIRRLEAQNPPQAP